MDCAIKPDNDGMDSTQPCDRGAGPDAHMADRAIPMWAAPFIFYLILSRLCHAMMVAPIMSARVVIACSRVLFFPTKRPV